MQTPVTPRLPRERGHQLWLDMQAQIVAAGLDRPADRRTWLSLALLLPLLAATLAWSWEQPGLLATVAGSGVLALLLAQFAFIGHNAGHRSAHHRAGVNRALGQLCMTLLTGLAFDEWWSRHQAHHRHCQDERRDPDMAVGLVASLTVASARTKHGLAR